MASWGSWALPGWAELYETPMLKWPLGAKTVEAADLAGEKRIADPMRGRDGTPRHHQREGATMWAIHSFVLKHFPISSLCVAWLFLFPMR